jgi:hypothetical protein
MRDETGLLDTSIGNTSDEEASTEDVDEISSESRVQLGL